MILFPIFSEIINCHIRTLSRLAQSFKSVDDRPLAIDCQHDADRVLFILLGDLVRGDVAMFLEQTQYFQFQLGSREGY